MGDEQMVSSIDFEYVEYSVKCCSWQGGHSPRYSCKILTLVAISLCVVLAQTSMLIQSHWPSVLQSKTGVNKSKIDSIDQLILEKRKSLQKSTADQSIDCFCPHGRHNWIHYTNCPWSGHNMGAGIKDRQNILRNIMWYADELCANVALQCTPKIWLSEKHGCFAPEDARWDVYFTPVRKRGDGQLSKRVDILYWDVNTTSVFKELTTISGEPSIKTYEMGRKLFSEGIPFVWNFNISFWNTDLFTPNHIWPNQQHSHRDYTDSCGIIDFDTSEELLNIGQLVLKELNITSSREFVTMHLRRGDWDKCDTSTRFVMNYLNCSIVHGDVKKVAVLTNGEKEYKENLTRVFNEHFPDKDIILLDDFIQSDFFLKRLEEERLLSVHSGGDKFLNDNCFRFSIDKVIISMARYHLERGHAHCSHCDPGGSQTDQALVRKRY